MWSSFTSTPTSCGARGKCSASSSVHGKISPSPSIVGSNEIIEREREICISYNILYIHMYIIFSSLSVPASAQTETFTLSKVTGSCGPPSPSPSQWEHEFSEGCGWIHEQACPSPSWLSQEGWSVLTKPLFSPLPSSLAFWNYPVVLRVEVVHF